ncbi:MAG: hypothetical protein PHD88_08300 [Firmicutes bacterium]|nr:hypothetical protein [Bacillota bacterium]
MKNVSKLSLLLIVFLVVSSMVLAETERIGVTLNATATIPAFISFTFEAIDDPTGKISETLFGSESKGLLDFTPGLEFPLDSTTKLINSNWEATDFDYTAAENSSVYIKSNQNLKTTIITNTKYKYTLKSSPMKHSADSDTVSLPLQVRVRNYKGASPSGSETWTTLDVDTDNEEFELIDSSLNNRGRTTFEKEFRIPYNMDYLAGDYSTTITFTVYTL